MIAQFCHLTILDSFYQSIKTLKISYWRVTQLTKMFLSNNIMKFLTLLTLNSVLISIHTNFWLFKKSLTAVRIIFSLYYSGETFYIAQKFPEFPNKAMWTIHFLRKNFTTEFITVLPMCDWQQGKILTIVVTRLR